MNNGIPLDQTWFSRSGPQNDVVVSSRLRFARNLSGFVFPERITPDDAIKARDLVVGAFNNLPDSELYNCAELERVNLSDRRLLAEFGVLSADETARPACALITRADNGFSCLINTIDHIRCAFFYPGLYLNEIKAEAAALELKLRACLRFAADVSLGYLTAALKDLGSGVKASVLLHLPALSITGSLNAILRDLLAHGFSVAGSYNFSGSNHSGYLFQISNAYAANGSEAEQIERVVVAALRLALLERRCVKEFAETKPTFMRDQIARSYAAARTARFVSLRESMDILARLRLGVNAGYIEGLDSRELAALLYKMKPEYVTRARDYASRIESDVTSEETRSDRTRALILKFALDKSVLLI